jgi:hypothetical protein
MTRYVGPAAEGARHAASVEPTDVLDLVERELWKGGGRTRKDIGLIGPALVAYFACCGGTVPEISDLRRGHFMPNKSERIVLPGARWVLPREVPLFEFAKLKLLAYVSRTDYGGDDDALFKNADGTPLRENGCCTLFSWVGERTGLPAWRLSTILREAFMRWMESCPSDRVRLYLVGKKSVGMGGTADVFRPQFTEARRNLAVAHPLAKLTREEMARPGAVRRAFPAPHFPTLSRNALSDVRTRRRGIINAEVKNAIRKAVASGKSVKEAAAHYRTGIDQARAAVGAGDDFGPIPKPSHKSYRQAILDAGRAGPTPTVGELAAKVGEKLGAKLSDRSLAATAKRLGIAVRKQHGFWDKHEAKLRQAANFEEPRSLSRIQERLAELGIEKDKDCIRYGLKRLGIQIGFDRAEERRKAFEECWPALRQELSERPDTPDGRIKALILERTGHKLDKEQLARLLASRLDLPPRTRRCADARRETIEAFETAWPALRAAMIRNPRFTDDQAVGMVSEITGRTMAAETFRRRLQNRNDAPPRARMRRRY